MDLQQQLEDLKVSTQAKLKEMKGDHQKELQELRVAVLGKKGSLTELLKGLKVVLSKAEGEKCPRCWHYTSDVGKVAEHAEICGRCVSNVAGDGEQRKFA